MTLNLTMEKDVKMNWDFIRGIYVVLLLVSPLVAAEIKTVSACHSSSEPDCNFITLECEAGSRIRLLNMKYGAKETNCSNRKNRCLNASRSGCCVYDTNDCTDYYNRLHTYNLYRTCSGKQRCADLPVPNSVLYSCPGSPVSTYVYMEYECVPDITFLNFCQISQLNATSVNLLFDKNNDAFKVPKNCSCFVKSSTQLFVDLVDVRLFKAETSSSGSSCSSADLVMAPHIHPLCDVTADEHDNFYSSFTQSFQSPPVEVKLQNLYILGGTDAPEYVWINVEAKDQKPVEVVCFRHVDETPTTSLTTKPNGQSTPPSNTTNIGGSGEAKDVVNVGAIVAGVLVPVLLLILLLVVFIIIRRRGKSKEKQPRSSSNAYVENSVENNEYAEIGFVPDNPGNVYDPVYEPKAKTSGVNPDSTSCNGHTYQNTDGETKAKSKKTPLGVINAHTNRLIYFFKKQTEHDFPPVQNRGRKASDGSYDHIKQEAQKGDNTHKKLEISSPVIQTHTNNQLSGRAEDVKTGDKKTVNKASEASTEAKMTHNVSAVDVGDSYIEFQVCDENSPNLLKPREENNINRGKRPAIPNRPPPSPSAVARLKEDQNSPKVNNNKDMKSECPKLLSPNDLPSYDYAAQPTHSRSVSNASQQSDVSSEHSYKILEPQQPVYDYANVSDGGDDVIKTGSVYEDVDKAANDRKHTSDTHAQYTSDGYLAPITTRTRTSSNPSAEGDRKN